MSASERERASRRRAAAPAAVQPSAREWLARLEAEELSSRELAEHYLARIEAVNGRLNAIVAREPELTLADADRADRCRRAGGSGPLLGLPLTIKDALDVAGFVSTGGSYAREGFRPGRDASAVERVRAAGAVVLGKSNAAEFSSSYETNNAIHGRTNHPLDPTRTPGGSSGGEGAILAADASPAGIGTDGGGSIRVPAHYCGIVGIRPTTGRVPETGVWPPTRATGMMDVLCVGPLGRFVADLELLLGVISGPDLIDPYAAPVPLADAGSVDIRRLRVGWYVDDGVARPTAGTAAAVERAAAALEDAGCEVEEARTPDLTAATELFFAAGGADGGEELRRLAVPAGGRHHEQFATFLELERPERPPSASDFFALQRRAFEFRARVRAFVAGFDLIVCPVVAGPAPLHGQPPGDHPRAEYFAYEGFNYTHTFAVAGVPAVAVPTALEGGLPVGVQVVAAAWREEVALAAAGELERALGGFAELGAPPER